jgi:transcriptional regulator
VLIRPHDAAHSDYEWQTLVSATRFGTVIAPGADRDLPVVVPTHFHYDGNRTILLHFARPNPIWNALRENPRCLCVVVDAVAYIPTSWEAAPGTPPEWGIPTTHYAAVELDCTGTITDDPVEIRSYLAEQLATMQPDEPYGDPRNPSAPYAAELRQIRGLRLTVDDVRAKFKFDGAEPAAVRQQVVDGYRNRQDPGDAQALAYLLRRHPPSPVDDR